MHLMMITLLTMGSAIGQTPTSTKAAAPVSEEAYDDCYDGGRMGHGHHWHQKHALHNTSPQTCYAPRFGCYHSNERHMNRYPAFHGTFYRQAYNYRNYFDYPWHAELHEPTSLFSYNVGEDQPEQGQGAAQPPLPSQARRDRQPQQPQAQTPTKAAGPQSKAAPVPQVVPAKLTTASSRQISSRRQ